MNNYHYKENEQEELSGKARDHLSVIQEGLSDSGANLVISRLFRESHAPHSLVQM